VLSVALAMLCMRRCKAAVAAVALIGLILVRESQVMFNAVPGIRLLILRDLCLVLESQQSY
jgi:hypothetical protein